MKKFLFIILIVGMAGILAYHRHDQIKPTINAALTALVVKSRTTVERATSGHQAVEDNSKLHFNPNIRPREADELQKDWIEMQRARKAITAAREAK